MRQRARPAVLARLTGRLPGSLLSPWPADPAATPQSRRRRRLVVAGAGLCGSGLLAGGLSARPGSARFYLMTLGVATTWTTGALASGPLSLGRIRLRDDSRRRPVLVPIATGAAAFGVFRLGALLARRIPVLDRALVEVLRFADRGSTPLVVLTTGANAIGEELFFRGALYEAVGTRRKVAATTAAYTVATAGSGNPALAVAAAAMGTLFGLQRRATGGIQAPLLTHLTWSMLMLKYLPPMFRPATGRPSGPR